MDTYFVTEDAASCILDSIMDVMQFKIHGFAFAVHAVIIQIEDFPRNIDGDILSPEYVFASSPINSLRTKSVKSRQIFCNLFIYINRFSFHSPFNI